MLRETGTHRHDYGYDELDRLTDDTTQGSLLSYDYDPNGNRLLAESATDVTVYSHTPGTNRLNHIDSAERVYDDGGHLIEDEQGRQYVYNDHGRLAEVYDGATLIATYTYNAQGLRKRKVTATETTVFHYNLLGRLLAETSDDGTAKRSTVWLNGAPVVQIDVVNGFDGVTYLHTDHLNTPRLGTNEYGDVVWRWESGAFGETLPEDDVDGDQMVVTVPHRFPGQYFDSETALHYNYHRYYDPASGRYLRSDPIGLDGGINTYLYAYANPGKHTDPTGKAVFVLPAIPPALAALGKAAAFVGSAFAAVVALNEATEQSSPSPLPFPGPVDVLPPMTGVGASNAGSEAAREECERQCDLEWDRNKFMCDSVAGVRFGFRSKAYKICRKRIDSIYVQCFQDCKEECD